VERKTRRAGNYNFRKLTLPDYEEVRFRDATLDSVRGALCRWKKREGIKAMFFSYEDTMVAPVLDDDGMPDISSGSAIMVEVDCVVVTKRFPEKAPQPIKAPKMRHTKPRKKRGKKKGSGKQKARKI